ncbi:MAG: NAD-binding protein [Chloroflexi bacterium]|nr:NAD-binding protein [Chloroflexota bacterium]
MKKFTFPDRVRYAFDKTLSRGPAGLIIWLAMISVVVVAGTTILISLLGTEADKDGWEILWNILFQTLTPNPVDTKAGSLVFLGGMLFVTITSLFLVSIFIGILTNTIDDRIQNMRKGRSFVVEKNHTLLLGWSAQIFSIIAELVIANENQKNPVIVVLAEKDKVEMEDGIRAEVKQLKNTRVVCRTGSPISLTDLEIVNPHAAKSIVILAPEVDDPDPHVIKSILALTNNPNRRAEPYHIVAQVRDQKNLAIARMVGGDEATLVLVGDLLSRIIAQTCRQSGLSVVYTELLDFGGDEIYIKAESDLAGKKFGEALLAYEDSALIGLRFADGRIQLNPPMDTLINIGDRVIAVSQDDDTIQLSGLSDYKINTGAIRARRAAKTKPERTLVLGWNLRAPTIVRELDHYVARGSEVILVADTEMDLSNVMKDLTNQKFSFRRGDPTERSVLDDLRAERFDHVIVLSNADIADKQVADAKTLITLLHLREIADTTRGKFAIVSEMLDVRNRELAQVTRADDFIVSEKLVSLMLSQLAENKELQAVFQDLFDPEGSEIYLKPVADYVELNQPVNFYTLVESARRRNEIALGYRIKALGNDAGKGFGVRVNPKKSDMISFVAEDRVLVLAED